MKTLRTLKLSRRLTVLVAIFALGFVVFSAFSLKTLAQFKVNGPVYAQIVQGKDLAGDAEPPPVYILESYLVALQLARPASDADQAKLIDHFKSLKNDYDTRHDYWSKANLDAGLNDALVIQAHAPAVEFYNIALNDYIPAIQQKNPAAANAALASMTQAYEKQRAAIDHLVELITKENDATEVTAKENIQLANTLLVSVFVLSLGLGITASFFITRSIIIPLDDAVQTAQMVAAGDFSGRSDSHFDDEPGLLQQALNRMKESLSSTVGRVRQSTEIITTASAEIATGNLDLSSRTEEQASSLEETASAMEQLTSTVKQNADNAQQANQLVMSASAVAVRGGHVVQRVVGTMGEIKESSSKIVDIIGVIDGIAFQTNILALNAAVEAARAGEQGRGFAVVASEVRNLAQRSAAAAKEIKTLIDASVGRVDAGSKLVDEAGVTMEQIVTSVKQVADIMSEITAASQEQSTGIEEVNRAINQMDETTQKNAALVEQAAAAASSMSEQADSLMQEMSVFKLADATTLN